MGRGKCVLKLCVTLTYLVDLHSPCPLLPALGQHCARIRWKPSEESDSGEGAVKCGKFSSRRTSATKAAWIREHVKPLAEAGGWEKMLRSKQSDSFLKIN